MARHAGVTEAAPRWAVDNGYFSSIVTPGNHFVVLRGATLKFQATRKMIKHRRRWAGERRVCLCITEQRILPVSTPPTLGGSFEHPVFTARRSDGATGLVPNASCLITSSFVFGVVGAFSRLSDHSVDLAPAHAV